MPRTKEPLPDFSDVTVRLKPLLGVAPGVYLTVLYALALAGLLFVFLFLPGIRKNGTMVAFSTDPPGAAIWVDGQYGGATPAVVFVPRGERVVELRKAFYEPETAKSAFGGRLFGSLIFPRRAAYRRTLQVDDWSGLIEWTRGEIVQWGMLRDFSTATPFPPLLAQAAMAAESTNDPAFREAFLALSAEFALFVDSEVEIRELLSGLAVMESRGGPFLPQNLSGLARSIRSIAAPAETSAYWLLSALESSIRSGTIARGLIDTETFTRFHTEYLADLDGYMRQPASEERGRLFSVAGVTLVSVPGGINVAGRSPQDAAGRIDPFMPYAAEISPFLMSRDEISRDLFAVFLAEDSRWQKEERVDPPEGYLEGWTGALPPEGTRSLPVTHVDHKAALAFCDWLARQLPSSLSSFDVRLPTENEWDWAARGAQNAWIAIAQDSVFLESGDLGPVGASTPNSLGIRGLWGNVWEWCDDWYFPATHLLASTNTQMNPLIGGALGSQRVVKGGSWANSRQEIQRHTRGSHPPHWATAYTGFRVVLAQDNGSDG